MSRSSQRSDRRSRSQRERPTPPEASNPSELPAGPPPASNGAATASLVLGVLSLCGTCVTGVPAVILGVIGLNRAGRGELLIAQLVL